jgi:hypothetical protein
MDPAPFLDEYYSFFFKGKGSFDVCHFLTFNIVIQGKESYYGEQRVVV